MGVLCCLIKNILLNMSFIPFWKKKSRIWFCWLEIFMTVRSRLSRQSACSTACCRNSIAETSRSPSFPAITMDRTVWPWGPLCCGKAAFILPPVWKMYFSPSYSQQGSLPAIFTFCPIANPQRCEIIFRTILSVDLQNLTRPCWTSCGRALTQRRAIF